jgi:hypothetical protein
VTNIFDKDLNNELNSQMNPLTRNNCIQYPLKPSSPIDIHYKNKPCVSNEKDVITNHHSFFNYTHFYLSRLLENDAINKQNDTNKEDTVQPQQDNSGNDLMFNIDDISYDKDLNQLK